MAVDPHIFYSAFSFGSVFVWRGYWEVVVVYVDVQLCGLFFFFSLSGFSVSLGVWDG